MSSSNDDVESSTAAEMEDMIARISSHKGVEGVLIMDRRGAIIQSTLDDDQNSTHAMVLSEITAKASHFVGLLSNQDNDELTFLRIRSKQREIMISPDKDYLLVVLQNLKSSE